MTNGDLIRGMSNMKLAYYLRFLVQTTFLISGSPYNAPLVTPVQWDLQKCLAWLESEAEK